MDIRPRDHYSEGIFGSGPVRGSSPAATRAAGRIHPAVHCGGRAIVAAICKIACYKCSAGRIQRIEVNPMKLRSVHLPVLFAMALLLAAMPPALRAQDGGPMQPRESTKFPTPPPPTKPEPPSIPPEEIVRRFAAKESELARA